MSSRPQIVIDIVGEGVTDVPKHEVPHTPDNGVLPVLVHKLCGQPKQMLVRPRSIPFLLGKTLAKKVQFARRQARYSQSAGIVFVVDSDGDWKGKYMQLKKGRDTDQVPDFPTALGVAHPCIEAWLLADEKAIQRAFKLSKPPVLPEQPEALPASKQDENHPKNVLRNAVDRSKPLSAREKSDIANHMGDMEILKKRCPQSFAPFAKEVQENIQPLFD